MKIDLLHYSAPPVVGGVESVLAHHARLMADAGYHVRILAGRGAQTDPRIPFVHLPLADSQHPDILSVKAELDKGCIPDRFSQLVEQLSASLNKALGGVETLIAHNVCSLHKNLPLTAALKHVLEQPGSPRIILWHHDLAWTTPRYQNELHAGFPWDLLRTDWLGAEQVAVSELRLQELAGLLGIPPERITVIPNGVDVFQFLGLQEQTQTFVEQLGLMAAEPLFLLPVRITPRKNIELALLTLAALQKRFPNPALVVTGPVGPHNPNNVKYMERLRAMRNELNLENKAHFLTELSSGYLSDSAVAGLYRLVDALILPSREEGFGIPILEAGLSGLPIFCTDIPPLHSLARNYATYFSPTANPEIIASLIYDRLSKDPIYRMRVQVRKNFTWEQIYSQYIAPLLG
ncbi:MAG: hypothetical protein A2W36_04345 [Chloroflexi bacterium RBG_16_58_14]|nr:MAG: hypothetical protein A2W36_04345 [Chloroflexi bacterium RBG_16_58_14]